MLLADQPWSLHSKGVRASPVAAQYLQQHCDWSRE